MRTSPMYISTLKIENFRSICNETFTLQPMSILIGKNNVGKTNLIFSIKLLLEGTAKDISLEDYFDNSKEIILEAQIENVKHYLDLCEKHHRPRIEGRLEANGSLKLRRIISSDRQLDKLKLWNKDSNDYDLPTGIEAALKQILPEVIYIEAFHDPTSEAVGKATATLGKIIKQILQPVEQQVSGDLEESYAKANKLLNVVEVETDTGDTRDQDDRVKEIKETEKIIEQQLEAFFGKVGVRIIVDFPGVPDLFGGSKLKLLEGGAWTFPDLKGQGLQRTLYFALLQTLAEKIRSQGENIIKRPFLLLVEEPELFLHPSLQMRTRDALENISTLNQIVIATHCPTMISSRHFYDTILLRKEEVANGKSKTFQLKKSEKFKEEEASRRIEQLLNYQRSSKFLFADKVVIVEGPHDVIIFEAIIENITKQQPDLLNISFIDSEGKDVVFELINLLNGMGLHAIGIVDIDFLWEGAGGILKGESRYSKFLDRFTKELQKEGAIQKEVDNSDKIDIEKAVNLLKNSFQEDLKFLSTELQKHSIFLLKNGEMEDYIGIGKRARVKFSLIAEEIRSGSRAIKNIEEIKNIIHEGLNI